MGINNKIIINLKIKIEVILIVILLICTIPSYEVLASIIKQETLSNGINTYYISNEKEFILMLNIVKARMETTVNVIYSDKMVPSSKTDLRNYYTNKTIEYNFLYQDNVLLYTDEISICKGFGIKSLTYHKDNTVLLTYIFSYFDTVEQSKYIRDLYHNAIKNNIKNLKTDYQKAYWAYHWILDNVKTDKTSKSFSAYNGLTETGTVCCGYSSLYSALANELGLDCRYIEGSVDNDTINNHAWNMLKLDGKWYCIDSTWGDNYNSDDYFLRTKDEFSSAVYRYHKSKTYDDYINKGEVFATDDYIEMISLNTKISLATYRIKMDILKYNIINVGEGYTFMICNEDNVPISYKSENSNIAKVDENGVVTGVDVGTTTVLAYNTDLNIEQSCNITVVSNLENPTLSSQNIKLSIGSKSDIDVKNELRGSKIQFTSSNPSVAKVNSNNGKVTAINKGKCKITCSITNGTSIFELVCNVGVQ